MVEIVAGLFYTPKETCDVLRISKPTFYRLVKRGALPALRIGGSWRTPV